MNTKIFAGIGLAVLIAIVAAAIVVTNPLSTEAADQDSPISSSQERVSPRADVVGVEQTTQPDSMGQLQAAPDSDTESKPYIGVAIYPMSDGTVKVAKVLEGGPSDGVLKDGDIITAVGGETIDGAEDLTDAIADAGAGETLSLTITRDGSEMDVSVTIGEWTKKSYRMGRVFHKAKRSQDRIASRQVVKADDDGNYRAYRTVFGSVSDLDADAGTFTLQPRDGSNPIEYTINDDTRIYVGRDLVDDLSGLSADEEVVVRDVDGEVKVVKQFDEDAVGGFGHRKGRMYKFGPGGARHQSFFQRFDPDDIRIEIKRLTVGDSS